MIYQRIIIMVRTMDSNELSDEGKQSIGSPNPVPPSVCIDGQEIIKVSLHIITK